MTIETNILRIFIDIFTQVAFSIGKFFYLLELCVFENDGYLKSEFVLGHYNFQVMKR